MNRSCIGVRIKGSLFPSSWVREALAHAHIIIIIIIIIITIIIMIIAIIYNKVATPFCYDPFFGRSDPPLEECLLHVDEAPLRVQPELLCLLVFVLGVVVMFCIFVVMS